MTKAFTERAASYLTVIPGSYAILLFTASDRASITSHIHNSVLFLLLLHPFILSVVISPLISSSILGTYCPRSFSFSILSFCLFILFMGFSRQEYQSGLPFLFPGMKELGLVILTCFFLSSAELTEKEYLGAYCS